MLTTIIYKELLDAFTSLRFTVTFALCSVVILLAMLVGIDNHRAELHQYHATEALNRANLESQPDYNSLAGYGLKLAKPPEVLVSLVAGVSAEVSQLVHVASGQSPNSLESRNESIPILAVFGELDLAFIVKFVLSLLALLFAYDAISGEKERGTLKLMLANGVPRASLILGKVVGLFAALVLPLVAPLLVGLILLNLFPEVSLGGEQWLRIGLILGLCLLYVLVFFTLGLLVSARTSRASSSLLVLLAAWVLAVMIIPKAGVVLAERLSPVLSIHEVSGQKDTARQEAYSANMATLKEWMKTNQPQSAEEAKIFQGKFRTFLEESQKKYLHAMEQKAGEIEEAYLTQRKKQMGLAILLSRFSPAADLSFGVMSLSRTGIEDHDRFLESVKAYQPLFADWAMAKMMRTLPLNGSLEMPRPDLSDMPQYSFQAESLRDSLRRALPDFFVLAAMALLCFAGAFVSFLRYDVR